MKTTRRRFLRSAAALAAATTVPDWYVGTSQAQDADTRTSSANDRPRAALIGCGGRGRGIARSAQRHADFVAICDVDEGQLRRAKETFQGARPYLDFRQVIERDDIDVVLCGTVDHWHALVSLAAMRSGKDVYCEKPLTFTIDEGKRLVSESKKTGRILQTGSQQRSDQRFRLACELVRNGRIGKLTRVDVHLPAGRNEGPFAASRPPGDLLWDRWQGPSPERPYVKERCHVTFRYCYDYSGGTMTDWGAHHNDIALWGLGQERSGPVSVKGKGLVDMIPGGFTAASEYHVEYRYENGVVHTCQSTRANAWNGATLSEQGQPHGVRFSGANGWIWVTRGAIEASDPEFLIQPLPSSAIRLYRSDDHMANFFACVRSRKPPICEAEIGHRSASVCHLGVIAIRLGRELRWDPKQEAFRGDADANALVAREMRKPYDYSMIGLQG